MNYCHLIIFHHNANEHSLDSIWHPLSFYPGYKTVWYWCITSLLLLRTMAELADTIGEVSFLTNCVCVCRFKASGFFFRDIFIFGALARWLLSFQRYTILKDTVIL